VGEILHAPAAFARMLINAGKAEIAVDEPLEE
jgi:hypothetical protein